MILRTTLSRALHDTTRFFSSSPSPSRQEQYARWAKQQMVSFKPNNRIRLVQTDGAGTVVDKYCLAPLQAFRRLFSRRGFELSHTQITGPMGIKKIKHIEHLLFNELNIEWLRRYGKHPNNSNVMELHDEFTQELNDSIAKFSAPTPHVEEAFKFFKDQSLLCALTTGYSRTTADLGMSNLYRLFDATTTADEVAAGTRMAMIKENMSKLKLSKEDMKYVIVFTDASSDLSNILLEADFPWVFGVSDYSTHVGISSESELAMLSPSLLDTKRKDAKKLLLIPRPHGVIKDMSEACLAVAAVNEALYRGKNPTENRSLVIHYPPHAINNLQEPHHGNAKQTSLYS